MTTFKGKIFAPEGRFFFGEVTCSEGIIKEIKSLSEQDLTPEERNTFWIPGLVDIHSHGCMGHDTCEATKEELLEMLKFQRSIGVTSYCFTTMTYPEDKLTGIVERISDITDDGLAGIYLEGPFISKAKKGAQNEAYIQSPDAKMLQRLCAASKDLVKVVAIAPEVDGALQLIESMSDRVRFSVAHTAADYDKTVAAFEKGATQVTHLYNAMSGFNHREPGVVEAVFDSDTAMAELICDGIHISDAVIRTTFKILGSERVILISDSMEATGMPDGDYMLGGQPVHKKGRLATLKDGTIAGSASTLMDCLKHAINIGVPMETAILAATRNPAKAIGIYDMTGSIEPGKKVHIVRLLL